MASEKTSSEQRKQRLAKALKGNIAKRKEAARASRTPPEPRETAVGCNDDEGCPN